VQQETDSKNMRFLKDRFTFVASTTSRPAIQAADY
jgi:hypothetical protein